MGSEAQAILPNNGASKVQLVMWQPSADGGEIVFALPTPRLLKAALFHLLTVTPREYAEPVIANGER
jgi:hypothetical protein